jgi:hypothetical protein
LSDIYRPVNKNITLRVPHNREKFSDQLSGKVKVNLTLEQAMKAQRGSRGIALLFL